MSQAICLTCAPSPARSRVFFHDHDRFESRASISGNALDVQRLERVRRNDSDGAGPRRPPSVTQPPAPVFMIGAIGEDANVMSPAAECGACRTQTARGPAAVRFGSPALPVASTSARARPRRPRSRPPSPADRTGRGSPCSAARPSRRYLPARDGCQPSVEYETPPPMPTTVTGRF